MKMAIVIRNDLKMGKGKMVAQGGHAIIEAFLQAQKRKPELVEKWLKEGQKKVVLKVNSEKELIDIYNKAKAHGLICSIIRDAGLTQLDPGTITAVAIGPDEDEK
ncbi:peptidyl-tRNA hydrolase [Methanocaldococcus villosus KIN24-T80]|uniref:Peptidyl-tRNA hydrolase n=2 Tax=Methanocaldococcus villosus TaxID=667126 RepID=N6UWC1_9EURY|nr:aminoacyl-tRNA hydrolase [Methanocaldococcus villosus]ENN96604.1 peptidyl-tRNA hydrolase [Methanocaldococcus villosus KIN24-T80]